MEKQWNYMNLAVPYDETLRENLRALASLKGMSLGDLVLEAVTHYWDKELATIEQTRQTVQDHAR